MTATTSVRDNIRNSISEITLTKDWDGEKRYPETEEVKQYQEAQKKISKSLMDQNLKSLCETGNGASTHAGIKLIKETVFELSDKFEAYVETTKKKSKYLHRFCTTHPNKKDTTLTRCRELMLVTLTHLMNSCLVQEESTKVMRRTITAKIGSIVGPKLLADKEQEQYINSKDKEFKPLLRQELMFFSYGVRDQEKLYKARTKIGIEIGTQLVLFVLDNSDMFEQFEITKSTDRKSGVKLVTIPYIQMTPDYLDRAQEMLSTDSLRVKGSQVPSIRKPTGYTSPSRYGQPLVRNIKYQYKSEETPSDFKFYKEDHSKESMPKVYEAIEHIESSKYTVDVDMLVTLRECIEKQVQIPGINTLINLPTKPPIRKFYEEESEFTKDCDQYLEERSKEPEFDKWEGTIHTRLISKWFDVLKEKVANLSKCSASMRSISTADAMKEYAEIFFPHNCDKRGRSYPLATSLQPQINDVSKGLLKSSQGCRVTEKGARWLRINIATLWAQTETYGGVTKSTDKMTLAQRSGFVLDNWGRFQSFAMNPSKVTGWTKADEPVQFLKAIKDYTAYNRNKETHMSHVSVDLDATCSGIQLCSMVYLDSEVAHSVNVSPTESPEDIYKDTAEEMTRIVGNETDKISDEVAQDVEEVLNNIHHHCIQELLQKENKKGENLRREKLEILNQLQEHGINRDHTKRHVMCLTYGLTQEGIRKYSRESIKKMNVKFSCDSLATQCFSHVITHALKKAAKCATTLMKLIQKVSRHLARTGKNIKWTTPVGFKAFRVNQRMDKEEIRVNYPKRKIHENSSGGREVVYEQSQLKTTHLEPTGKMHGVKMANAMAPDFVHSLDASLLMLTVLKAKQKGINFLKLVHDSFGTLCEYVDDLNICIREAACEMFKDKNLILDWCLEVTGTSNWEECKELINTEVLKNYKSMDEDDAIEKNGISDWEIEQGDLDIECVLASEYFFS